MITKDNFKLYKSLFDDINHKLTKAGLIKQDISDINDYFMELEAIKEYVQGNGDANNPENDPYFLILPLDEGLFEIDANTRKVKIPEAFILNGVGVQGDELAEIVYFSIDRYFDTTDLYDKEIFIQWEAQNGDSGLSVAINKTLSFKPGKVVFGWPITSEMTKGFGKIKFAVRFYERGIGSDGNPILTYSFSTLTSEVKINQALDFKIDDESTLSMAIINKNHIIYSNLRNSEIVGPDFPAVIPTFDYANFSPVDRDIEYNIGEEFQGRALFTSADDENGIGTISYSWIQKKNGEIISEPLNTAVYKVIDETETVKNKYDTYYIYDSTTKKYSPYLGDLPPVEGIVVYKMYASLTPDRAGEYYLVAQNEAGRGNYAENTIDKPWIVAFPKAPNIIFPVNSDIIEEDNFVYAIMNKHDDGTYINLDMTIENVDNGILNYQWKSKVSAEDDYVNLLNQTGEDLKVEAEGYYILNIINSKNNDTKQVESKPIKVTYAPDDIKIEEYSIDGQVVENMSDNYYVETQGADKVLGVKINNLIHSDAVVYQWYKGASANPVLIEGATAATYTASGTKNGRYFVKITNKYNKHSKIFEANGFSVMAPEE